MKNKILYLVSAAAIIVVAGFNATFTTNVVHDLPSIDYSLTIAAADGEAGGEEDPPGNWDSEYPECEYQVAIGVPPVVIIKTIKGSYRNCVSGSGVCLWNDPVCCTRVYGICVI